MQCSYGEGSRDFKDEFHQKSTLSCSFALFLTLSLLFVYWWLIHDWSGFEHPSLAWVGICWYPSLFAFVIGLYLITSVHCSCTGFYFQYSHRSLWEKNRFCKQPTVWTKQARGPISLNILNSYILQRRMASHWVSPCTFTLCCLAFSYFWILSTSARSPCCKCTDFGFPCLGSFLVSS